MILRYIAERSSVFFVLSYVAVIIRIYIQSTALYSLEISFSAVNHCVEDMADSHKLAVVAFYVRFRDCQQYARVSACSAFTIFKRHGGKEGPVCSFGCIVALEGYILLIQVAGRVTNHTNLIIQSVGFCLLPLDGVPVNRQNALATQFVDKFQSLLASAVQHRSR